MTETFSTAPNGEQFPLPTPQDEAAEILRLQALVADHRAQGHEIVVVLGVGFVGAVMAGIIADSVRKPAIGGGLGGHDAASCPPNPPPIATGQPTKFVIGVQRPSPRSYWKIPLLNKGVAPVEAEDPEVAPMIARCVLEKKTLTATYTYEALCLADVIVVDVQCDYFKETLGDCRKGHAEIAALRNMGKIVAASKVALLGASYREDVGDTRYSGSEIVVRKLTEMGAEIVIHDPYVKHNPPPSKASMPSSSPSATRPT